MLKEVKDGGRAAAQQKTASELVRSGFPHRGG
jgi:hypothetical protein